MTDEGQIVYMLGESRDYWRARAEAAELAMSTAHGLIRAALDHPSPGGYGKLIAKAEGVLVAGYKEDTNAAGATETRRVPRRLPTEPDGPKTPHGGGSEATGHTVDWVVGERTQPDRAQTLEEVAGHIESPSLRYAIERAIRAWRAAQ